MGKTNSKWFLCFRRSPTIEIDTTVDCSANRVLTYITAVKNKSKEMKRENKMKKRLNKQGSNPNTTLDSQIRRLHHHDNLSSSQGARNLSGLMKAAFSRTATMCTTGVPRDTKFHNNCADRSSHEFEPTDHHKSTESALLDWRNTNDNFPENPTRLEKKTNGNLDNFPENPTRLEKKTNGNLPVSADYHRIRVPNQGRDGERLLLSDVRMNHVMCLVVFSLWMTVFWGKILAVTMTTVSIYVWERKRTRQSLVLGVPVKDGSMTHRN